MVLGIAGSAIGGLINKGTLTQSEQETHLVILKQHFQQEYINPRQSNCTIDETFSCLNRYNLLSSVLINGNTLKTIKLSQKKSLYLIFIAI